MFKPFNRRDRDQAERNEANTGVKVQHYIVVIAILGGFVSLACSSTDVDEARIESLETLVAEQSILITALEADLSARLEPFEDQSEDLRQEIQDIVERSNEAVNNADRSLSEISDRVEVLETAGAVDQVLGTPSFGIDWFLVDNPELSLSRLAPFFAIIALVQNKGGFHSTDDPDAKACADWILTGEGSFTECGFTRTG